MPTSWSAQIADRYHCELSPQLVDWFDTEQWKQTSFGEFRESVTPEQLLEDAPEVIWPGLMACNLLPILGNNAGDWLCVSLNEQSVAKEIVHWYHGGGDWIPWGKQLAEAIAFDHLIDALPGPSLRHAIPAENPRPTSPASTTSRTHLDWASEHLPSPISDLLESSHFDSRPDGIEIARLLIKHQIAEPAVQCEMVSFHLLALSGSVEKSVRNKSDDLDRIAAWCFDLARMPKEYQRLVEQATDRELSQIQNWELTEAHARTITKLKPELAWGWDLVGYAAERRGELDSAKSAYRRGAQCLSLIHI